MLIHHSPPDSWLRQALAAAEESARIPTTDKIRERQAYWTARGN